MAGTLPPPLPSAAGKFFRKLADFFDRLGHTRRYAGTPREVDIVSFLILFAGLITIGTLIHGRHFIIWNSVFALFFCGCVWLLFRSALWSENRRRFLLTLILILSVTTAAERIIALFAFIVLLLFLLQSLRAKADFIRKESLTVIAVILFCFTAYEMFSGVLEFSRTTALSFESSLPLQCGTQGSSHITCRTQDVAFDVPEFWHRATSGRSNLVKDLKSAAHLKVYDDSATDNTIAFAAFNSPSAQIIQNINNFLSVQKSFLRSKGLNKETLVPQQILKSPDAQLYLLRYESSAKPGYLAEDAEFTALILLHERHNTTWLFIVDGTDISGREFLLHRVISGFH